MQRTRRQFLKTAGLLSATIATIALLPQNPHVGFIEARERGYMLCEVNADERRTAPRSMPDARVVDPNTTLSTARTFAVGNGRAGAQRA